MLNNPIFGIRINRLLPKCNDRNKEPKRPILHENLPISALFEVKNVLIFSNSSQQYSVNKGRFR